MYDFGFTPSQAKRLTTRKGNRGYCIIEDRDGQEWLVDMVGDNGCFMSLWLTGTDGTVAKSIVSREYKDYKITVDDNDVRE